MGKACPVRGVKSSSDELYKDGRFVEFSKEKTAEKITTLGKRIVKSDLSELGSTSTGRGQFKTERNGRALEREEFTD